MSGKVQENRGENKFSCSRWIATCVDMFEHPVLDKGPFDRRSAWLWMIAAASWKDRTVNHKGKPFDLKRGQLFAGRKFLAQAWGWSEKQVRFFIELLMSEGMIEKGQSDGHFANIVTICNYDVYQSPVQLKQPEKGPEQGQSRASEGPEQGQTLTRNTKDTIGSEIAREGEEELAHGVFVNCETIRHRAFSISLPAIRMGTLASGLDEEAVKTQCIAHALQWALEIENGKRPDAVLPSKIANFLAGSIMGSVNRQACHETRSKQAERAPAVRGDWAVEKAARGRALMRKVEPQTEATP